MDQSLIKSELSPGFYVSPGFYMQYWKKCIESKHKEKVIYKNTKLQKHREMYVGAIFAASQTELTGVQHFVGLSEDEPPDIDVVRFVEIKTPKGTPATKREIFNIEVTRCDLDVGETLIQQIDKKNNEIYKDMFLIVHTYGDQGVDLQKTFSELSKKKVWLKEIYSVGPVSRTENVEFLPGTYGLSRLYPAKGQSIVNLNNAKAFFYSPSVVKKSRLATGTKWEDLGKFKLLAPSL